MEEDLDNRLALLRAKCSHEAFVLLGIIRKHEDFSQLLSRLESFTGEILDEAAVELAFYDISVRRPAITYGNPETHLRIVLGDR